MDTYTLQYLLDYSTTLKHLHGIVCAKDELEKEEDIKRAYIVNTDNSDQPGKHWILIHFKNNIGFYYDSYGSSRPMKTEIVNFLNNNSRRWTRNNNRIQSINSIMCGVFCIFVLDTIVKGVDLPHIMTSVFYTQNQYSNQYLYKNDIIVSNWFNNHYGKLYKQSKEVKTTQNVLYCKYNQCCTYENSKYGT